MACNQFENLNELSNKKIGESIDGWINYRKNAWV